jgi:hypothetical protein
LFRSLFLLYSTTRALLYIHFAMPDFSASFSATLVRTLLAVLLLAVRLPVAAQAPAWQSARAVAVATAAASSNSSFVNATTVDAAGNVFLAGTFSNTVVLGGNTLTSLGSDDVFVAKFNPASNQFVWAKRAGGTGSDRVAALAMSSTSIYIAGFFDSSTAGFGPVTLTNAGYANAFVAKLTDAGPMGSFVWAQRAGGTGGAGAYALAVNGTSVYVAGDFQSSTADFGPVTLTNAGYANAFVAKLTDAGPTGSFVWAQRAGGTGTYIDTVVGLAASGTSVYVTGGFTSPTAEFGVTTLVNAGVNTSDLFVAKLTDAGSTGAFIWAQRAGGTDDDGAAALAVSGTNVFVTGSFRSATANFASATLTNADLVSSPGTYDVFVTKLTDAGGTGNFVWAQRGGGTGDDIAYGLAVNGVNLYIVGSFRGLTAGFGTTILPNAGSAYDSDAFVAKLTDAGATGSFGWAQRAGGTGEDRAFALALGATSVYVTGYIQSATADFGTNTLSNPNATYLGFLASLADPTLTATTTALPREPAQLYPNPAHHTATLRLPAGTAPGPLTLTNALGRAVRRYPAPASPETTLDLHGLPAGLYLLRGAGAVQHLQVE